MVEIQTVDRAGLKTRQPLPSALANLEQILSRGRGKHFAIFLDYDGTLAPITQTPDLAVMSQQMRHAVITLSTRCTVGIISGRDLQDIRHRVNVDAIAYGGSHGFDLSGPKGIRYQNEFAVALLPLLDQVTRELILQLAAVKGVLVERKKFAITIHYRLADEELVPRVEATIDRIVADHPQFRKSHGKKMFELMPNTSWNKGEAVLTLLKELHADGPEVVSVYIGDDLTDEDVFQAIQGKGIGILVGEQTAPSAASFSLRDPEEVREFLLELTPFCRGGEHSLH